MSKPSSPAQKRFSSWVHFLRMPNLLTVPGDVLVGFYAMTANPDWILLLYTSIASCALYALGIMLNDFVDLDIDSKERPTRPLPAGEIPHLHVVIAMTLCYLLAQAATQSLFTLLLFGLIVCYNGLKRFFPLGIILMGACRSANVLLGAAIATKGAWQMPPIAYLLIPFGYIVLLSLIARNEATHPILPRIVGFLLGGYILLQTALLIALGAWQWVPVLLIAYLAFTLLSRKIAAS